MAAPRHGRNAAEDGAVVVIESLIDIVLLTSMGATAIAVLRVRNLFAVAMLSGFYSFLAASMFVVLDAVDVAFTEAAVGAGVSTVLVIAVLALTRDREKIPLRTPLLPLVVVVITGFVLLLATPQMPAFGDIEAPANKHVVPRYMADTVPQYTPENEVEVGIPNVVTTVLASYRGYDTLGEVTVIFTAGVAVMMLVGGRRRNGQDKDSAGNGEDA
jgi:multicomponent Na+:H+ antiporter subunit B